MMMNQQIAAKRNSGGIKEEKISLVLTYIQNHPSTSRIEIAKSMNLNPATVGRVMDDIIGWGLLEYAGAGESSGGRKPDCYSVNPKAGYALGVDITKRGMEAALFNLAGEHEGKEWAPFVQNEDFFEQLSAFVSRALEKAGDKKMLGVGVGMSGNIIHEVVKYSNVFEYRDVPLGAILRTRFTYPLIVEERVKCAAYACKASGNTAGYTDVVYMQIGMGIGMGIIMGGEIYNGGGGNAAGEIGHTVLEEGGPLCFCGSRGCLEQFASEQAMIRAVTAGLEGGRESAVTEMSHGDLSAINGNMIVLAAEAGDELCAQTIREACRRLALGIHNMFMLLNPGKLIIKNNISENNDLIGSLIYDSLKRLSVKMYNWPDKVVFADDRDIVLRGGARIMIDKMFENPKRFYGK